MLNGFISLTVVYLLYVVKKGHEQVEKTLEMKKWSRNGKVIKQGRNVYDVLASNTCSIRGVGSNFPMGWHWSP